MSLLQNIGHETWLMIAEMGPYLLLGFAISVLLYRFLKQSWVERLMGRRKFSSIIWGSVIGVPMPLCSCGVIPITMSLRGKGASKGATVSFLTSTPQTGVDSFLATYAMLGPIFALYKVVVAFISGILVGSCVEAFGSKKSPSSETAANASTCGSNEQQPNWSASLRYGFFTMPGDLAGALLIGFVLAGTLSALAPPDLLANIPGGALLAIPLATVLAAPLYICSTGSIPLALALVQSGLPVSAALALLLAGPATSITTIIAVRRILGGRTTAIYAAGVVITTCIAAAIFHLVFAQESLGQAGLSHHTHLPLWKQAGGAALLGLLLYPFLHSKLRSTPSRAAILNRDPELQTATIKIEGMTCSHCESSVSRALAEMASTVNVIAVDRATESATIQGKVIEEAAIKETLNALGFSFKGLEQS